MIKNIKPIVEQIKPTSAMIRREPVKEKLIMKNKMKN